MRHRTMLAALSLALAAGVASADSRFTLTGIVIEGTTPGGTDLAGEGFAISLFVDDVSQDQIPADDVGGYPVSRVEIDLFADGAPQNPPRRNDTMA